MHNANSRSTGRSILMYVLTIFVSLAVVAMFGIQTPAEARGGRGGGGRGGGGRGGGIRSGGGRPSARPMPSRPSGGYQRPSTGARPGGGSYTGARPSPGTRPGGGQYAGTRPPRPTQLPSTPRNNINNGNINIGNDIDVSGSAWGWGDGGYWGAAALGAATGAAIAGAGPSYSEAPTYVAPTTIYSLPPSCTPEVINGVTYQNCNGTYYEPTFSGSTIEYQQTQP